MVKEERFWEGRYDWGGIPWGPSSDYEDGYEIPRDLAYRLAGWVVGDGEPDWVDRLPRIVWSPWRDQQQRPIGGGFPVRERIRSFLKGEPGWDTWRQLARERRLID